MAEPAYSKTAYMAGNRFGLGLRQGEADSVGKDPSAWLLNQLQGIAQVPAALAASGDSATNLVAALQARRLVQQLQNSGAEPSPEERAVLRADRLAQNRQPVLRMLQAITTQAPFAERLVRFWSNHFSVTQGGGIKLTLRRIALPYENEAIRAKLGGSFENLVLAVVRHPAMLIYLDNQVSAGPNSQQGRQRGLGLNENFARELLELHTLGVNGGYTQEDVISMASMLSGWTVDLGGNPDSPEAGRFVFRNAMHEPGAQLFMGKQYPANGQGQVEQALLDLARHPATARHVATKLARHFIADDPPEWAVARLERTFLDNGGSLPLLHAELVAMLPAIVADDSLRKLKSADEFVVSTARALTPAMTATQIDAAVPLLNQALGTFGQAPFAAPSPAGWPDIAEYWGSPDTLLKRVKWAQSLTPFLPRSIAPLMLYRELLPPQSPLESGLMEAMSNEQGLALLFGSPQFQWR